MTTKCKYNELTGNSPTLHDCEKCEEEFGLPYRWCCLKNCEVFYFEECNNCKVRERVVKEIEE